jgi:transcriptional regulator with XRE-family HTH domain
MNGEQLKAIRTGLSLSQQQLADRLEIDRRTVGRYERDEWPVPAYIELAMNWLQHVGK